MKKYDLEDRLIAYAVNCLKISGDLESRRAGNILSGQLIRSSSSTALNYGEAQSGESKKDFIHKIKIVLKELRESNICLKIIYKTNLIVDKGLLDDALIETNELISIFVKSVETAQKNLN